MNKLGFYVENTTVPFLRDALRKVEPPVLLVHASDRTLLQQIRDELSPDTFVIGRLFVNVPDQIAWLTSGDPKGAGVAFAERVINYDFQLSKQRGRSGRLLIDAWMSLNEPVRGPASFPTGQPDAETQSRYDALDRFQIAFHKRLRNEGLESVAFNFAAGNFTGRDHVVRWFPRTLEAYKYLAFHEYGWPTMMPRTGTQTGCLYYRPVMEGVRAQYSNRHQVIISEAGLARLYKYPGDPAGDVGWLYRGETISEPQYWESLQWYNGELVQDDYVMGCCLYQVGHAGLWETFRHLGVDNAQQPILLVDKIATLREDTPLLPTPTPTPTGPPATDNIAELLGRVAVVKRTMATAVTQANAFVTGLADTRAVLDSLVGVTAGAPPQDEGQTLLTRLQRAEASLNRLPAGVTLDVAEFKAHIETLRIETELLLDEMRALAAFNTRLAEARRQADALEGQSAQAQQVNAQAGQLVEKAAALEADLRPQPPTPTPVGQPALRDVRGALPTGPGEPAPQRSLDAIRRVVIHHTVTRDDVTPERVAAAQVARGQPGITYHFLVTGDGTIHWTQPLEAAVEQSLVPQVNADSVAVALAGNFQQTAPTAPQLDAAAQLIAWLLTSLGLPVNVIFGRNEVDSRVASPGTQWSQGVRYRDTLIAATTDILSGAQ